MAIAHARLHPCVSKTQKSLMGLGGKLGHDLDRKDMVCELGKQRRLVPAARSDLKNTGRFRDRREIGHEGHHEGL